MKKILYIMVLAALSFGLGSCYKDKGSYDYKDIGQVALSVTSDVYKFRAMMGDQLVIPMSVATDVPESEITYKWERADGGKYIELFDGKDFDCEIGPATKFPSYGDYLVRLKAVRQIDGYAVEAYSPMITITVSGESGLMVLHGNDTESDIGIIQNPVFMVEANTEVVEKISYDSYSVSNGAKIPGKGQIVLQQHVSGAAAASCYVYIVTDQTALYAGAEGLVKIDDYSKLFLQYPGRVTYHGKPEVFQFFGTSRAVVDDGDLFGGQNSSLFDTKIEFNGLPNCKVSKYSYIDSFGYLFDMDSKAFWYVDMQGTTNPTTPFSNYNSAKGPFNVGDMKADLLYFDKGGATGHFLGVFKDNAGQVFLGEINFNASNEGEDTYAYAKYGISRLPGFDAARFHGFGANASMCYYATSTAVYQYALLGGSTTTEARKLVLGSTEAPLTGEVTMMKVLRPRMTGAKAYQYHSKILLVGTYENGVGTVHAFTLDELSGNALTYKKFTGFGRVYDINLKSM